MCVGISLFRIKKDESIQVIDVRTNELTIEHSKPTR